MTGKKVKELRELNDSELEKMRADLSKAVMAIRFKSKIEKTKNPMEIRNSKKKIAVINTLLTERKMNKA